MPNCETCNQPLPKKETPAEFVRAVKHYAAMSLRNYAVHNLRIMVQSLSDAGVLTSDAANAVYAQLDYDAYEREAHV